jgi:DNA-binding winged helix-turn-helix (wHTH) protein
MQSNGSGPAERVDAPIRQRTAFGAFRLEFDNHELLKHGLKIRLPPKCFELLAALLERPGFVVMRDELRARLWPNESQVDFETGLNTAAYRLRTALGDSAEHPRYIETLPRLGYRFIAPVMETPLDAEDENPLLPADDLEAVRRVVRAVQHFDAAAQQRVLRWAAEKLGLAQPA